VTEREHSIPQRWTPNSPSYQAMDRIQMEKSKRDAFAMLEQCARERWFLLTIKAKHAGTYMRSILVFNFAYICTYVYILWCYGDWPQLKFRLSEIIVTQQPMGTNQHHIYNKCA